MERVRTTRGFTLIELLAVIAIILLLVSLLAPVLSRMTDKARFLSCMSNVRQMVAANVMYAGDNQGHLVGPNWVPSGDPANEKGWLTSDNRHQFFGPAAVRSGLLFTYLNDERIYRCPADPQSEARTRAVHYPDDTRMLTSYIMNGSVCGYGRRSFDYTTKIWDTYRLGQFRPSDFIYWEGDETINNYGDWWDGANSPNQGISGRHIGDNMVGRVDGAGERLTRTQYYDLDIPGKKTRLWNVPDSATGR